MTMRARGTILTDSTKSDSQVPALVSACAKQEHLQIHIHAIGDAAIGMTIDALAYARGHNGSWDSRHLITHLHVVD